MTNNTDYPHATQECALHLDLTQARKTVLAQ